MQKHIMILGMLTGIEEQTDQFFAAQYACLDEGRHALLVLFINVKFGSAGGRKEALHFVDVVVFHGLIERRHGSLGSFVSMINE